MFTFETFTFHINLNFVLSLISIKNKDEISVSIQRYTVNLEKERKNEQPTLSTNRVKQIIW